MRISSQIVLSLLLTFTISCLACAQQSKFIIIAHADSQGVDLATVKQLYTLKRKLLPNGARAKLSMMPPSFEESVQLSQNLYSLFPYQLSRIWDTQVFSGKATMPKEFASPEAMLNYVIKTPNAFGYLIVSPSEQEKLEEQVIVIAEF